MPFDIFAIGDEYMGLASIGCLATFTGGHIRHLPGYGGGGGQLTKELLAILDLNMVI